MIEPSKLIQARRLTQAEVAEVFGVTQPRVSDLVRGKIDRFSIDTLVAMLGHAGVPVHIVGRDPEPDDLARAAAEFAKFNKKHLH